MSYNNETFHESYAPKINEVAQKYIDELLKEKARLPDDFPLLAQVIDDAIDRIFATGRIPRKELQADVYKQLPMKVTQNVYLPVKQYPKFNFMGKLLGPRGSSLKQLNQETLCHIAIKGRHSMRNEEKEEQLRQSGNPVFNHLNRTLFVEISTIASPAEAYARIAYALAEIRKYIIPDKNDEISQEQYRELLQMHPEYAKEKPQVMYKSVFGKYQGPSSYRGYDESDDMYERRPPSPPVLPNPIGGGYRSPNPRRSEPSTYQERARDFRPRPYQGFQKYAPYKK